MESLLRILAEVQEDLACDGEVSEATQDMIAKALAGKVLKDLEAELEEKEAARDDDESED